MSNELFYSYLTGRNRTDRESGGIVIHAVKGDSAAYPNFGKAICGAQPGKRSNGWSEYRTDHATCPKCLKKLGIV